MTTATKDTYEGAEAAVSLREERPDHEVGLYGAHDDHRRALAVLAALRGSG